MQKLYYPGSFCTLSVIITVISEVERVAEELISSVEIERIAAAEHYLIRNEFIHLQIDIIEIFRIPSTVVVRIKIIFIFKVEWISDEPLSRIGIGRVAAEEHYLL